MLDSLERRVAAARRRRWLHLAVVNVRLMVGFAFVPAGLKKVLDEPFTDPTNTGLFHDFLHTFHATGPFYRFVGIVQLAAALLLFSQRHATLGAIVALPVVTAIGVFCWSTAVYPTATVVTLMFLATLALLVWDLHKWRGVLAPDDAPARAAAPPPGPPPVDLRVWQAAGVAILALYLAACAIDGGVYRPRGPEGGAPFLLINAIPLVALGALFVDIARHRRRRGQ